MSKTSLNYSVFKANNNYAFENLKSFIQEEKREQISEVNSVLIILFGTLEPQDRSNVIKKLILENSDLIQSDDEQFMSFLKHIAKNDQYKIPELRELSDDNASPLAKLIANLKAERSKAKDAKTIRGGIEEITTVEAPTTGVKPSAEAALNLSQSKANQSGSCAIL